MNFLGFEVKVAPKTPVTKGFEKKSLIFYTVKMNKQINLIQVF